MAGVVFAYGNETSSSEPEAKSSSSSVIILSDPDSDEPLSDAGAIALIIFLILLCIGCIAFYIYLWRSGKLANFLNGFKRGPRSATVRYSSLTGDNDWLEDDDDDMLGGDVATGAAPVVVVQDSSNKESSPAASTSVSSGAATATKNPSSGAAGSWEIKWDEDLDDDGGISAWGTLPVNKPASSEQSSAETKKPVGSNPFEDDDDI